MGIFSGCLLASDYDGTLANSKGEIDKEVRDAIKYFTSNGGYFTVCTGRTKQGFHAYSEELMNAPVLLANGSMAYDFKTGETIFVNGIEKENLSALNYIRDNYHGIGIEYYGSDFSSYVINPDDRNVKHFNWQFIDFKVVNEYLPEAFPIVKVMVSVGEERCEDFQRFLDTVDLNKMKYIPQHGNFIEIIYNGSDKGKGLLKLAESLGVDRTRVFCVGDGANDVDMLKAAQIGFVPENGDILAKQAGNAAVKSNDEFAVADVIYKIEKYITKM
ncbi:MAG: Cof-type HAD-IIB family hydrolase [Clostridia bacterium]|nr:Cof-type HAD-IIB family hydrolase [Clostridia bacterium]